MTDDATTRDDDPGSRLQEPESGAADSKLPEPDSRAADSKLPELVRSETAGPKLPAPVKKPKLPARAAKGGVPTVKSAFDQYVEEITRIPLLSREEEVELAQAFQKGGDKQAGRRLVEANLRFVVKMAFSYRHYDVKVIDLIQEGNIGLMRAVEKFNPDRGYRLISYAVWWIKAYMQNYIIRSWSMVKLGTSAMQRQLFFRQQSDKSEMEQQVVTETLEEDVPDAAGTTVLVPAEMRRHRAEEELTQAARDFSLDATIDSESKATYVETLPSPDARQDERLEKEEIMSLVADRLKEFVATLGEKELYILQKRLLTDEPETLQEIGTRFHVSRERVRQMESQLKERLRKALKSIEGVAEIV
jgi:RNA polymerase sigma-32 factor